METPKLATGFILFVALQKKKKAYLSYCKEGWVYNCNAAEPFRDSFRPANAIWKIKEWVISAIHCYIALVCDLRIQSKCHTIVTRMPPKCERTTVVCLLKHNVQYSWQSHSKNTANLYYAIGWGRAHKKPTDNKGHIILLFAWPAFTLH